MSVNKVILVGRLGQDPTTRYMTSGEVMNRVGLGRTAIYDAVKAGTFPKPVKLGVASRWVESEVAEWIAKQIHEHREAA